LVENYRHGKSQDSLSSTLEKVIWFELWFQSVMSEPLKGGKKNEK